MTHPAPYGTSFLRTTKVRPRTTTPPSAWTWTPADPEEAGRIAGGGSAPCWDGAIETRGVAPGKRSVLLFDAGALTPRFLASLEREGLATIGLDPAQLMGQGFVVGCARGARASTLRIGDIVIDLADVAAVIWNPPVAFTTAAWPSPAARDAHLTFHRWRQAFLDLRALIPPDALWLPGDPLRGTVDAQHKLAELRLAHRLGLAVPDTIVTNDGAEARRFVRAHRGRVLFREFSRAASAFKFETRFVGEERLTDEALARSPVVLQQYVAKRFEVRAVVVGDRVLAARVESQASRATAVDWRAYDFANVPWRRWTLPAGIQERLVALARELGVSWGSADLICGPNGRYTFLELNRPGAVYWLLPMVGIDVVEEVVRCVASHVRGLG